MAAFPSALLTSSEFLYPCHGGTGGAGSQQQGGGGDLVIIAVE